MFSGVIKTESWLKKGRIKRFALWLIIIGCPVFNVA